MSLGGFLVSYSQIDQIGPTGRAPTDVGEANFTINSSINIQFTTRSVEFGVGNVNGSGFHNCTLNTSTASYVATDCSGFTANVPPLRVQNQGTQNVTLNISFNSTGAALIGGTSPEFSFKASENQTGACNGLTTALTVVSAANTNYSVCSGTKFNWLTNNRTLNLDIGLRIPQDAPPGAKRMQVTAYASNP